MTDSNRLIGFTIFAFLITDENSGVTYQDV